MPFRTIRGENALKINDKKVVVFHYKLFNEAGEQLESSAGGEAGR